MTTLSATTYLPSVQPVLSKFRSITLEEMDSVKLLDRFDKKFVFRYDELNTILNEAARKYRVLQIGDHREFVYRTLYFDTPEHRMYLDHHNRKLNRYKIRRRDYLTGDQTFFEIKFKTSKGRTRKKRIRVDRCKEKLCKAERKFIRLCTPYDPHQLLPKLQNQFSRVTLVHKDVPERSTIDFNLVFDANGKQAAFPSLVIAEIKQDRSSGFSDLEKIFRAHGILPMKLSKYCIGSVYMYDTLKYNRFKSKIITLNKLCNDSSYASVLT